MARRSSGSVWRTTMLFAFELLDLAGHRRGVNAEQLGQVGDPERVAPGRDLWSRAAPARSSRTPADRSSRSCRRTWVIDRATICSASSKRST